MTVSKKTSLATGKRFYTWRDEAYWSVTTILGALPKPALLPWGIKMVAEAAVDATQKGILGPMVASDPDGAIRWLKASPYAARDKAADVGTYVHAAIEAYALGKPFPKWAPAIARRMEGFEQFVKDHQPEFHMTEASVLNRTQRYAGTLDSICTLGDRKLVLDAKSGKGIYPEIGLQLAAYRFAEFVALPDGSDQPMPHTDGAVALHLPDSGVYDLYDVRADDEVFRAFLFVREVFKFTEETAKTILTPFTRWEAVSA